MFQGASVLTGDSEWVIEESDANDLATRTITLLKTLDSKNAAKIEKKIAKYAPSVSLVIALTALVGPRVAHTRKMKRETIQKKTAANSGARAPAPAAPTTNSSASHPSDVSGNGARQPDQYSTAPIRRQNWPELFGRDDA